jgi:hypothetical protein
MMQRVWQSTPSVVPGFPDAKMERLYQREVASASAVWSWFSRAVLISVFVACLSVTSPKVGWRNWLWIMYQWGMLVMWLACWATGARPSRMVAIFAARCRMPVLVLLTWLIKALAPVTPLPTAVPASAAAAPYSRKDAAWVSLFAALIAWGTPMSFLPHAFLSAAIVVFASSLMLISGVPNLWSWTVDLISIILVMTCTAFASDACARGQFITRNYTEHSSSSNRFPPGQQQLASEDGQEDEDAGGHASNKPSNGTSDPRAAHPSPTSRHPSWAGLKIPSRALSPGGLTSPPIRPRKVLPGIAHCHMAAYRSPFTGGVYTLAVKQPDAHAGDVPRMFSARGRGKAAAIAQAFLDRSPHLFPRPAPPLVASLTARPGCVIVEAQCVAWRGRGRGPQTSIAGFPAATGNPGPEQPRMTAAAWLQALFVSVPGLFRRGGGAAPLSVSLEGQEGRLFDFFPDSGTFVAVEGDRQVRRMRQGQKEKCGAMSAGSCALQMLQIA